MGDDEAISIGYTNVKEMRKLDFYSDFCFKINDLF